MISIHQLLGLALGFVLATSLAMAAPAEPRTAFAPGEPWPDNNGVPINAHGGGILLHDKTYYWFGEHKIAGGAGNAAHVGVHVYSSKDLYNWTDRGIALKVSEDPDSEITNGCVIERPKVIYNRKTHKFVMWFHLELKGQGYSAARAAVAVADQAEGPYQYQGSFRPNAGVWPRGVTEKDKDPAGDLAKHFSGGQMARDMNLFVDDDGTAYQLYSSENNGTMDLSRLSDDYLKPAGDFARIWPFHWREAPAMFKHKGKYYLITSGTSGWAPNRANTLVASSIWGPYTSLGDPSLGPPEHTKTAFESQSTYVLPVPGNKDAFIYMGDRWRPENAIDGRYVWLPLVFVNEKPRILWRDAWSLKDIRVTPDDTQYLTAMERAGASVKSVDSADPGNPGEAAIDGDPKTLWHTAWDAPAPNFPHTIVIQFPSARTMQGITVLPRQDDSPNGRIKDYAVYVSKDNKHWGAPTAQGAFDDTQALKTVVFATPQNARFVKFVARTSFGNTKPFASVAEIEILFQK